ncbi:MAG: hypothetical protein AB1743_05180 [Actinomycetota bacterium]
MRILGSIKYNLFTGIVQKSEEEITDISNIGLAHYVYIPTEDERVIKDIWAGLVRIFNINSPSSHEILLGDEKHAHRFPVLLRGNQATIGLLVIGKITAIEVFCYSKEELNQAIIEDLQAISNALDRYKDYFIGESTVILSNGSPEDSLAGYLDVSLQRTRTFEIAGTHISIAPTNGITRHHYIVHQRNKIKMADFLTSRLPALDSLIFTIGKKAVHFKYQHIFVKDKRADLEHKLSNILKHWTEAKPSGSSIEALEKDIDTLSIIYDELMGYLRLVKDAHDKMSRDLHRFDSRLEKFIANSKDLQDFKDLFVGETIKLMRELEFDDELLHRSLDDTRATIEVVRTRIELERSRESFFLQKEGVSIQIAAGFIELFIVGFYTLEAWALLSTHEVFERIPVALRLATDLIFAIAVVAFTHAIAKFYQKRKFNLGLLISGLVMLASVLLMIVSAAVAGRG